MSYGMYNGFANYRLWNYTRKEFNFSSFQRTFTLPDSADGENIQAEYKDGILSIAIPKKEEAKVKPAREIEIV